ncbi:ABC transporter substrate-binding protein [Actinomadura formosensis]|uniref:ABC transporter substrate-binding protein n=1 Tax=Actinomadura formosensis TaxID=60706 RepID=UPI003D9370AB
MFDREFMLPTVSAAVFALAATGCGTTAAGPARVEADATPGKTSYPLTLDNCGQKVAFTRPPRRVLILNGTSVGEVESFIMLGLQRHILANAQSYGVSDDPAMASAIKALPTGGLKPNRNFEVPAEQVLAAKPDLVVSHWSGGFDARKGLATREQLAAAGINTLVNPVNCAYGKPEATPGEKRAYEKKSIESSFEFLRLLGRIFDVQHRAAQVTTDLRRRLDAVRARTAGRPPKRVLIAYPGMSAMNANGLPAVWTGRVADQVVRAAGGVNAFEGRSPDAVNTINKEQLAAAQVDVLVVGVFQPNEDPAAAARGLFAGYPQWRASKTRTYATVAEGVFLGPLNAVAAEKLARVVQPDA